MVFCNSKTQEAAFHIVELPLCLRSHLNCAIKEIRRVSTDPNSQYKYIIQYVTLYKQCHPAYRNESLVIGKRMHVQFHLISSVGSLTSPVKGCNVLNMCLHTYHTCRIISQIMTCTSFNIKLVCNNQAVDLIRYIFQGLCCLKYNIMLL